MSKLNQKIVKVFSPYLVTRGVPFQIIVCTSDNSDKTTLNKRIYQWQTDAKLREENIVSVPTHEFGDINCCLNFYAIHNEAIIANNGGLATKVEINDSQMVFSFVVTVLPEFEESGFLVNLQINSASICLLHCSFNIVIKNQKPNKYLNNNYNSHLGKIDNAELFSNYKHIFNSLLFGNELAYQCKKIDTDKNYEVMTNGLNEKIHDIRNVLYTKNLLFKDAKNTLTTIEEDLSEMKSSCSQNSDIGCRLIPALLWRLWNVQTELNRIEQKYKKFDGNTFDEFETEFILFEPVYLECLVVLKILRDQTAMLKEYLRAWELIHNSKNRIKHTDNALKKKIKECAKLFYERVCHFGTDKELFDIFTTNGGTKSIIHSKTGGEVTLAFLALFIALVNGSFISIDYGKEAWRLDITSYIDLSEYHNSLRTPKNRIKKTVGLLDNNEIRNMIRNYQLTEPGKVSVSAFCMLRVKLLIK